MSTPAIALNRITPFGSGLHRPECVLPAPNGDVYVPDWRGGVSVVRANGTVQSWLAKNPGFDLKPNGIGFLPDGRFLIANLGDDGGIWAMDRDGNLSPFLTSLAGKPLPPANFVYTDEQARVWVTVSTRHVPRQAAWRADIKDGLLIMVDRDGPHLLADDLHYTNEARTDPSGTYIYVVETFGRRLIRYPIAAGARLGSPELVVQLGPGRWPDGFVFDQNGGIWITSLVSNEIVRLDAKGELEVMIREANLDFINDVERAYAEERMERAHLGPIQQTRFQHLTSIGFGGPGLATGYLGSLHADCLYQFAAPVAGAPQPYWAFPLP